MIGCVVATSKTKLGGKRRADDRDTSAKAVVARNVAQAPEGVEGDDEPDGIENYPLDELLIRTDPRAIQDVLRRIEKSQVQLDPDFQRDFVWPVEKQSRLIESVLMRIPLQVFYFAEDKEGKLIVVDGLQRLSTFRRFHKGELTLDLKARPELHGKTFSQLAPKLQTRFEDSGLTFYVIGAQAPEQVRLDIFERVNAGVPLTRQQMRNALYSGPATRKLRELAMTPEFTAATGFAFSREQDHRSMRDREAINRYLAYFHLGWGTYKTADYDEFLAEALRKLNRDEPALKRAALAFVASMRHNQAIFGGHAFRKSLAGPDDDKRLQINIAMFDVFSVGLARYAHTAVPTSKAKALRLAVRKLLAKSKFVDAITFATAKPANVHTRFEMTEQMLREVLGAPTD